MLDREEMIQEKSNTEKSKFKINVKFLIATICFYYFWIGGSFSIGCNLWDSDISLVYGIMSVLFSVGSIITGILVGYCIDNLRTNVPLIILFEIFVFGGLSLIAGVGLILSPYYIWEYVLPWVGVVGSTANVIFIAFITQKLRLRKQLKKIPVKVSNGNDLEKEN